MEEGKDVANLGKANGKGEKVKVYLEDIHFLSMENQHEMSFKHFVEKLRDELKKEDCTYLEKKMALYKSKKIQAQELFDIFYDVFGLKDVNAE